MLLKIVSRSTLQCCFNAISINHTLSQRLSAAAVLLQCQKLKKFSTFENGLIFRQLFHGDTFTYTYILGCKDTHQALIIDPVDEMVDRDVKLCEEMNLSLIYGVNTHVHADHVTGTGLLKKRIAGMKSVISKSSNASADMYVTDGDTIKFGNQELGCRFTPGHTGGCMTYVSSDRSMAFTGDAVLIRACGRTDFQEGDAGLLYDSVHEKIFSLPDKCAIYPGHDYRGFTMSTVEEEKLFNPRLTLSKKKFIEFMHNLNLAYPKLIDKSVPANLKCGKVSKESVYGSENLLNPKSSS